MTGPPVGPRLGYVLDVFCSWFGWNWSIQQPSSAGRLELPARGFGVSLHYGIPNLASETAHLHSVYEIAAAGLLAAQSEWPPTDPVWGSYCGLACPTGDDPLAGIFWCLSLVADYPAEHRATQTDAHGRMLAVAHPLFIAGLAEEPIADRLAFALACELWRTAGRHGEPQWYTLPHRATSDLDAPLAFRGKSLHRRFSGVSRGIISDLGRGAAPLGSWISWVAGQTDPFDTYAFMAQALADRDLQQDVFTLVGYNSTLDPGFPGDDARWKPLWLAVAKTGRLGLHPSYFSSDRPDLLAAEKQALEETIDAQVTISRQHFLRLKLPHTFRELLEVGIQEEHSLMWAECAGFRAGTARSFHWYDLERERSTALLLVPPHAMEVTARRYQSLTPTQALASWTSLAEKARQSGSSSRIIWHNSNLSGYGGWGDWRKIYLSSLDLLMNP